jgi:hypothetical protein
VEKKGGTTIYSTQEWLVTGHSMVRKKMGIGLFTVIPESELQ